MHLTEKERMLLEDQKKHEELCVKKYKEASQRAQDPELKQLFSAYAQKEQEHLDTVNQILNGQVPNMQQQQGQQQQQNQQQQNMQMKQDGQQMQQGGQANQQDEDLCNEMLVIEKYVSGTYDTAVFEFRDTNIRQVLNHIQKEEQQHGEAIFNYMQKKGMYNPS
jgi:spore coat protein CotF